MYFIVKLPTAELPTTELSTIALAAIALPASSTLHCTENTKPANQGHEIKEGYNPVYY